MTGSFEYSDGSVVPVSTIVDALLPLFDAIAAADPGSTWEPWYMGQGPSHLYPSCPGLRGKARPGRGTINPEGDDICGWCQRVWRARS